MNTKDTHAKLQAAQVLLLDPTSSREKFTAVRTLIQGIHPQLDAVLKECDQHITSFEKAFNGQLLDLGIEQLPETTEEEKRCKKALLLILGSWNKLKSEIARVQVELAHVSTAPDMASKGFQWAKLFKGAKGPLGIITILAIGIVVTMHQTSVTLVIKNKGCGAFQAIGSMPIQLPGLQLPSGVIENDQSATAVIPPLTFSIDGTQAGIVSLKALAFNVSFQLPANMSSVTLDGVSLIGVAYDAQLSKSNQHELVLVCN